MDVQTGETNAFGFVQDHDIGSVGSRCAAYRPVYGYPEKIG
jgi:hypothetical protein